MATSPAKGIPLAACGWWVSHTVASIVWACGGPGWPFGPSADAASAGALLVGIDPGTGGPVAAAVGVAGIAAGVVALTSPGRHWRVVTGLSWTLTALLVLTVLDARPLLVLFQLLTGNTGGLGWPVLHQTVCVIGIALTAAMARTHRRHAGGVGPRVTPRWARWAVVLAVGAPLAYAGLRWAWALGWYIGADSAFIVPYTVPGARITEAILGLTASIGALLTLGLVRPFGRVIPRWVPVLAGRPVPALLAILPAMVAAVALSAAGLSLTRGLIAMAAGIVPATPVAEPQNWGGWLPAPLWTVWGLALAATTLTYHRRRSATGPTKGT